MFLVLPGLITTLNQSGYSKKLHIYGPRGIKDFGNLWFLNRFE